MSTSSKLLTIECFGRFSVSVGDRAIEKWEAGKSRHLLQFLILNRGEVIRRNDLHEALWPEGDPGASSSLRVAVHVLRGILEEAHGISLNGRSGGYILSFGPGIQLDLDAFDHHYTQANREEADGHTVAARSSLSRAAEIYRGDIMVGDDAHWLRSQRQWYRARALDAIARLRAGAIAEADWEGLSRWSKRLLQIDPYHEASYRSLIQIHLRRQDQLQANAWFERCRTRLAELGVAMHPRTLALSHRTLAAA